MNIIKHLVLDFVLGESLHRGHGDLYRIGKILFHRIFLQYKGIQAW